MADLTCELGSLKLKNPVMTASGTFGYGMEYHQYYDIAKLGAVVVKGIATFESWQSNAAGGGSSLRHAERNRVAGAWN